MHEQCTANMHKCQCMKFSCIISGCPAGARKWHISYFAMLLHGKPAQQKDCRLAAVLSVCQKTTQTPLFLV